MRTAGQEILEAGYEPHVRVRMPFEIMPEEGERAEGERAKKKREIVGVASAKNFAGDGLLLDPAGFPAAIADFMEWGAIQSGHRLAPEFSVGLAKDAAWSEVGMTVRALISHAPDVESTWVKIEEGILRAFSIGFFILEGNWDETIGEFGTFVATRFSIVEVSVVRIPADPGATFQVSRALRFTGGLAEMRERLSDPVSRAEILHGKAPAVPVRRTIQVAHAGHSRSLAEDMIAASAAASAQRHLLVRSLIRAVAERVQIH